MKREYDFSQAKRAAFRRLPAPAELARHTKVRITIMLDLDVLDFFKARAAKRGADPYQTQINRALREYMVSARAKTDRRGDERFISQFAERVANYVVQKRGRRARPSRRPRDRPARA